MFCSSCNKKEMEGFSKKLEGLKLINKRMYCLEEFYLNTNSSNV